jgi:hypothetical protein
MESKPINGLGDVVEVLTNVTGIKKLMEYIGTKLETKCRCEERKAELNKLLNWRKMDEDQKGQYEYLATKAANNSTISAADNKQLTELYNQVYSKKEKASTCSACVSTMLCQLKQVYDIS